MSEGLIDLSGEDKLLGAFCQGNLWLDRRPELLEESPIIIGGSSGGGTRLGAWLCEGCNVYMGWKPFMDLVHPPHDSMPIAAWMVRHVQAWLLGQYPVDEDEQLYCRTRDQGFWVALDMHLAHWDGNTMWGWKNPGNQDMINFYHQFFPNMKYIHIARDGRDISAAWMKTVVDRSPNLLPKAMREPETPEDAYPYEIIFMWLWDQKTNRTLDYCEREMKGQHLILRMEDIAARPEEHGDLIRSFIGAEYFDTSKVNPITLPATIGRHNKDYDKELLTHMTGIAAKGLTRLGYIREATMEDANGLDL